MSEEEHELFVRAHHHTPAVGRVQRAVISCAIACVVGAVAAVAVATSASRTGLGPALDARRSSDATIAGEVTQLQQDVEPCQVFWQMGINDMVAEGWGSRMLYAAAIYQRYHLWADECTFYTSEAVASEWESWGLEVPFEKMPDDNFALALADPSLQSIDDSFKVGLRGYWRGEAIGGFSGQVTTNNLVYSDWAGCWTSTYDTVLNHIFKKWYTSPRPLQGEYIGIHVRHGDKEVEGPLSTLEWTMTTAADHGKGLSNVFLATDDASVIQADTVPWKAKGFDFTWTDFSRHVGGEPKACDDLFCHHDNKDENIKAVLADTLALAQATVLVGNWGSNFFRLGWLLNYLRRTEEERQEDWCVDIMTNTACNGDRHEFVTQFVSLARQWVPEMLLPAADSASLRDCTSPSAT